jgi:hypothetical protein
VITATSQQRFFTELCGISSGVPDDETTFEKLQAEIMLTIDLLKAFDPDCMDSMADMAVHVETKLTQFHSTGQRLSRRKRFQAFISI